MHRCHACGHEQEHAASGLVECDECGGLAVDYGDSDR
jgi:predicted  nucleic acid-binding Zn-ribbon protein